MAQTKLSAELASLLKRDNNNGWKLSLFEDQTKISHALCAKCHSICCDAVELGCDEHEDDDEEVYLYCKNCLRDIINKNNQQCPINNHDDPIISSNRAIRRTILKSIVFCPYSVHYKKIEKYHQIINDNANRKCR